MNNEASSTTLVSVVEFLSLAKLDGRVEVRDKPDGGRRFRLEGFDKWDALAGVSAPVNVVERVAGGIRAGSDHVDRFGGQRLVQGAVVADVMAVG